MFLFVWPEFAPDYMCGLAFALAEDVERARELVIERKGYNPSEWGPVEVHRVDEPIAFAVSGGG